MEYYKFFVREDGTVNMRCPVCTVDKVVPYDKLPRQHRLTVKCQCGSVFKAQIELRKSFRKDVNFNGLIQLLKQGNRPGQILNESHDIKSKPINCRITNISLGGIGLTVNENVKLHENDLILAKFNLDNSATTRIEKQAVVRRVKDNSVGCEFIKTDDNDKALKFYFL
jgi:hypothetical protein